MVYGIYKQVAKNVMSTHLVTIRPGDTVHDALLLMAENRVAALPVVDYQDKCLGMISQGDIIAAAREKDVENADSLPALSLLFRGVSLDELTQERVEDLMSSEVIVAAPDDPVTKIADGMLQGEVHHVPVVDESERLIGIVSTMDILAALREPLPSTTEV